MLRISLLLSSILLLLISCQEKLEPIEVIKEIEIKPELIAVDDFNYDTLKGIYTGDFSGSKIRIILNYVSKSNAIGYNIHKGLQRNISGKVLRSNDTIFISLAEPGDHEFDGMFNLTFVGEDYHPTAIWASNSGEIIPKNFTLEKTIPSTFDDDELSEKSISEYFQMASDTIGDYFFEEDGFVSMKYYKNSDMENRIEQYMEVKGTWTFDQPSKTVSIDWEKNDVFQEQSETFDIIKEDYEFFMKERSESGRTITTFYW